MTHREFVSWRALFRISPFDDERCFDVPGALVAFEVNRMRGGSTPFGDFIPHRFKPPEPVAGDVDRGLMNYLHSRNTRN